MEFMDGAFERLYVGGARFDDEEEFFGAFDCSLPVIERGDGANDVDAGGEFAFEECRSEFFGVGAVCECGQGDMDAGFVHAT